MAKKLQAHASKAPKRPDTRRSNAKKAQRPPHRGEAERIAERRVSALELRKTGLSYRAIGHRLGVDVATAWADVNAELFALREQTQHDAQDVRDIELERSDVMVRGLWPAVERGDPKAIAAAVRVSERRARLLGLDAPTHTKAEITDGADVMNRVAFREKLRRLPTEALKAYESLEQEIDALRKKQEELIASSV